MVRTEIRLFLRNKPGELGRLSNLLADNGINVDALTIQDASDYVRELFKARGKSIRRIASASNYNSMQKDSLEYALIRLVVSDTDKAVDLLSREEYLFDFIPVIALEMDNKPGSLAEFANTLGEQGINIHYVYGSAVPGTGQALFVFCPEDIDQAIKIFKE
ncbi:MAG: ACT domain-containing protein [Desulfatibacillum sp.]|nr:ACT domain-containing protein [Desulfatibacillum sp.]